VNLDAGNTAIVLDSTADFPDAPARFANARVVPLYVSFDGQSFRDGIDIHPDAFYERLGSAPTLPTTSQPAPGDFLAVYEELAERYERILSLQISSTFSGTFASAQAAAAQLGDDRVRVIDTRAVSVTVAMLALAIERRLERGTTDEEIDALIARYGATHGLLFTVDTLDYMAKGGRIGRAAAFAGNLLNVKPMLTIRDGEVVPLKRVRGSRKAFEEFATTLESESRDVPALKVGLAHAAAPERLEALRKLVREVRPQAEIEIATSLGAVIGTHTGPGTVALFWFEDTA
jgi:DegV family protein with EDD domain